MHSKKIVSMAILSLFMTTVLLSSKSLPMIFKEPQRVTIEETMIRKKGKDKNSIKKGIA